MNDDCINRSGVLIYFAWRNCSRGLICKAIKRVARQVKQIVFAQFLKKKECYQRYGGGTHDEQANILSKR